MEHRMVTSSMRRTIAVLLATTLGHASADTLFIDASDQVPAKTGIGHSMNAKAGDVDGDGDLDIVVAMERQANRLLLNDGRGRFAT
jgi:FG-GAP-like repeat